MSFRFCIAWIMMFGVAMANIAVGWCAYDFRPPHLPPVNMLVLGILPMVTIMAGCVAIGSWRGGSLRFVLGFEAFGLVALASYVAALSFLGEELVKPYLYLVIGPLMNRLGPTVSTVGGVVLYTAIVAMLVLPQLLIASIGGVLNHKWRAVKEPDASG